MKNLKIPTLAFRSWLPRLLNTARRLTVLAMLACFFILPIFYAEAQPVLTPSTIHVKSYASSGSYSNTMNFEIRTGNYIVDWTTGLGGTSYAYSLRALPTFTNAAPYVIYEPWKTEFTDSLTTWPPYGQTGTNRTITGKLAIDPQIPTAITNVSLAYNPPGSYPPYYYVTNVIVFPPIQNVTNITIGWEQPVFPPPWPHYTDIVSASASSSYYGQQTSIATNTANVAVDLFTGTSYNTEVLGRPNKFTLLSASATSVNNNWLGGTPIGFANISVAGEELNADYCAFVKKAPGIVVGATPSITTPSNFTYNVGVGGHKIVRLSRAYHYRFGSTNNTPPDIDGLRSNFEAGAELLYKDHDLKVPDNDPSLSDSNIYNWDDVPLYVEFEIINGTPQLPSNLPIFPAQFQVQYEGEEYFEITAKEKAFDLLATGTANILQVKSMAIPGSSVIAYGQMGGGTMLIIGNGDSVVLMHELGHLVGLHHRGQSFTNYVYDSTGTFLIPVVTTPNPGPATNAIMNAYVGTRNSINRRERDAYNSSNIPVR